MPQPLRKYGVAAVAMASLLSLFGCGGPKQARVSPTPPPPAIAAPEPTAPAPEATIPAPPAKPNKRRTTSQPADETAANPAEPQVPDGTPVISSESGLASWYGPPYNHRRGSNGEIYDMNAMTAAHKTLPLGSIVRVTNVNNGRSAVVRITDRGPFIPGRVIDLSLAAARKLDVWRVGVAPVRLEVLQTPAPLEEGGKWAVQIGGFPDANEATSLADHLTRRYRTAKVLSFASPAGDWWVRVRVLDDDRARAAQLAAETKTTEGAVFLVRLD